MQVKVFFSFHCIRLLKTTWKTDKKIYRKIKNLLWYLKEIDKSKTNLQQKIKNTTIYILYFADLSFTCSRNATKIAGDLLGDFLDNSHSNDIWESLHLFIWMHYMDAI